MEAKMVDSSIATKIRLHRNTAAVWAQLNLVLQAGEPGYEKDTGKLKIGDGYTKWNDLDYFLTDEYIRTLIEEVLADEDITDSTQALLDHINSLTPHPVYDDGPSLELLYENAKV
jgi:hypothetical protein